VKAAKTQTLIAHAAFLGCWPLGDAGAAPGTYYPHIKRNNREKSTIFGIEICSRATPKNQSPSNI
jgi:hypothetical protein